MALTRTEIDILLKARADLQGFKSAKGEIAGIKNEARAANTVFKDFGTTARTALGALGIGFSVQQVVSGLKSVIDYGSKITDLARQTRTSTDEFQALSIAASDAGIEQQQLANALVYLQKSISETASGTGEAVEAFRELGLDARKLSKLPVSEALEIVAKATLEAKDQATAYGYALDILGSRNAPKLQEVLERLAKEGFGGLKKSAEGLIIPKQILDDLDDMGDQLNRVKIGAYASGAAIIEAFSSASKEIRSGEVPLLLKLLANPNFASGAVGFNLAMREAAKATKETADQSERIKLSIEEAKAATEAFAEAQKFIANHIADGEKARLQAAKETLSLNERAAKLGEQQDAFELEKLNSLDRYAEIQRRVNSLKFQQAQITGTDNKAFEQRLGYQERILAYERELYGIKKSGVEGALTDFFGNIDDASESMNRLKKETKETKDAAKELGNVFASAFESAITRGGNLRSIVHGLFQDILQLFVREQVSAPIANFFSGFFKGIFGGGKAVGGDVQAGKFYKVGEKGTELFAPGMSGTIIPNNAIASAVVADTGSAGGDMFNFNYTFTGGVTQGDIARMIPQIVSASKNAVRDAKRRLEPGFA